MCVFSKFVGHGWAIEVSVLAVGVWVLYTLSHSFGTSF